MIILREVEDSDQNEWIRMRKLLFPECSDERHVFETGLISSSQGIVLVAELSQSALVGFAEVSIRHDHVEGTTTSPVAYLEGWYVEPAYRGKGIGKDLIRAAEKFATEKGFTELASDTDINSKISIEIHKGVGFKEVGRSVHFVKSL